MIGDIKMVRCTGEKERRTCRFKRMPLSTLVSLLIMTIGMAFAPPAASAQGKGQTTVSNPPDSITQAAATEGPSQWDYFTGFLSRAVSGTAGFIFGLAILAVFTWSLTICLQKAHYLYFRYDKSSRSLADSIISCLSEEADRMMCARTARAVVANDRSPLGKILHRFLNEIAEGQSSVDVGRTIEQESSREIETLESGLPRLHMLANVATLTGLLGTIVGLIMAFSVLASLPAAQRAQQLTDSISLAMATTAFGLVVAIPTLMAHSIFSTSLRKRVLLIEESVNSIAAKLEDLPEKGQAGRNHD